MLYWKGRFSGPLSFLASSATSKRSTGRKTASSPLGTRNEPVGRQTAFFGVAAMQAGVRRCTGTPVLGC